MTSDLVSDSEITSFLISETIKTLTDGLVSDSEITQFITLDDLTLTNLPSELVTNASDFITSISLDDIEDYFGDTKGPRSGATLILHPSLAALQFTPTELVEFVENTRENTIELSIGGLMTAMTYMKWLIDANTNARS